MTAVIARRRTRVSIRALMIVVALCALLLAPVVIVFRQVQFEVNLARMTAENARAQVEIARLAKRRTAQRAFNAATAITADQSQTASQSDGASNLWAALTANHLVFEQAYTKDLTIEFNLVNDGETMIDPKITDSMIVINGKELAESGLILGKRPEDARFKPLLPGDHLQFSLALGDHFKQPGIYRVSWKGNGFQSPEITIRILPETRE
jgi:type II secretory pathway pseudopilin PulG